MLDDDARYFLAVIQERNLARAAGRLGLSQSALTRSVQRLEGRYRLRLLDRTPRGVEPTAAGLLLGRALKEMNRSASDAERALREMSTGKRGEVRIGTGMSATAHVRTALIPKLHRDRPGATLQLDAGPNYVLLPALEDGQYDFLVVANYERLDERFTIVPLWRDDLVPVVRAGHPLARLASPTPAQIFSYPLACSSTANSFWRVILDVAREAEMEPPTPVLCTNHYDTVLMAVSASDAVGMVPLSFAGKSEHHVVLSVPQLMIERNFGLIRRGGSILSSTAQRAMELILQTVEGPSREPAEGP